MLQKLRGNNQGFTLIELMIVIAIIGILAAIAIPNFIAYRNKSFCSTAESDANSIAGGLSDYFSVPSRTSTPATAAGVGITITNTASIEYIDSSPNNTITIKVTDDSTRCPADYRAASDYWSPDTEGDKGVFTKYVR